MVDQMVNLNAELDEGFPIGSKLGVHGSGIECLFREQLNFATFPDACIRFLKKLRLRAGSVVNQGVPTLKCFALLVVRFKWGRAG